jgi:hypothetical protein
MSQDTLFFKESCIVISINITGTGALCVTWALPGSWDQFETDGISRRGIVSCMDTWKKLCAYGWDDVTTTMFRKQHIIIPSTFTCSK